MSDASQPPTRGRANATPDRPPRVERNGPAESAVAEIGGPKGPEPTRYGDWERGGRCIDF